MATDYTEFVELAQELISENGRQIEIQKLDATAADTSKPWKGAGTPTVGAKKTLSAVFVPASGSGLGRDIVKEELLDRVEQVALVAPTDVSLEDFHIIMDDGVRWNIDWAQALKPGPMVVLYVFGVKR
ncbi:MAG: hypothetical protein WCY71_09335 [Halothiobacillaceae bacterium]